MPITIDPTLAPFAASANTPGYRPSQWVNGVQGSLTIIVLNPVDNTGTTIYVFDGIPKMEHNQDLVATLNPVQTGANITDHAYTMPAKVTVEIAMSDTMQSYIAGQFSGTQSRSVSAYQVLLALQFSKSLLSLATRLRNYSSMLITSIRPDESVDTAYALKCYVTFQEIILASASNTSNNTNTASSRGDAVNTAGNTNSNGTTVPQSIENNNAIENAPSSLPLQQASEVPGAGGWSSLPINQWSSLPPYTPPEP